ILIEVSADNAGAAQREVDARDAHQEDFELVMEDASVYGEVRDADGHGVPGASVRVVDGPSLRRHATTDPGGAFSMPSLAPGDYTLEVSSPDFPTMRIDVPSGRS